MKSRDKVLIKFLNYLLQSLASPSLLWIMANSCLFTVSGRKVSIFINHVTENMSLNSARINPNFCLNAEMPSRRESSLLPSSENSYEEEGWIQSHVTRVWWAYLLSGDPGGVWTILIKMKYISRQTGDKRTSSILYLSKVSIVKQKWN